MKSIKKKTKDKVIVFRVEKEVHERIKKLGIDLPKTLRAYLEALIRG